MNSFVSAGVLFIFQFPAIMVLRYLLFIDFLFFVSLPFFYPGPFYSSESIKQAMPGSSLPSMSSREAPPPVEMWVTRSQKPSCSMAAALSPPPMMDTAPDSATARAKWCETVLCVPYIDLPAAVKAAKNTRVFIAGSPGCCRRICQIRTRPKARSILRFLHPSNNA